MNRLYPLFVKLEGRFCVVVGGGTVAAGKVHGLRSAGAVVTVISPDLTDELAELWQSGLIRWIRREFISGDLDGARLVIAATGHKSVSAAVHREAEQHGGLLCNAVDNDENCSFHVPAVAARGDIKVAISTAGKSPAFAAHLRAKIQDSLREEDVTIVRELGRLRPRVLARYRNDAGQRKALFQYLVASYVSRAERGPENRSEGRATFPGDCAPARPGTAYLVGAGPGDAGLLTARGAVLLQSADIVLYDRLVGDGILEWIPPHIEKVYVGKELGRQNPADTGAVIVDAARDGKAVVRLKGGDPSVFGRGGDEMLAILAAGVPLEVVPGVSALNAVPSAAGIPITFRQLSQQVVVRSGYRNAEHDPDRELVPPAPQATTYVYFMTVGRLSEIVTELRDRDGLEGNTPIAIVQRGTLPDQRVLHGTLDTIVGLASRSPLVPPAMVVAGEVVRFVHGKGILSNLQTSAPPARVNP